MTTTPVLPRSEMAVEYTWDASSIFPSHEAWEEELGQVSGYLAEVQGFQGKVGDSPVSLADWLDGMAELWRRVYRISIYAGLFHHADTGDQTAAERSDRATGLYGRASAGIAFAEPEILAIGEETLRRWAQEEPRLHSYAHYLDELLRRAAHIRSAEVEEVMGLVMDPFYTAANTAGFLTDTDMSFRPARTSEGEEVEVAQGNLDALLHSPDRTLRQSAWESYADTHLAFKNTLANALASSVKQDVFRARVRRYDSALEASLSANHIPVEVFHNLIATYRKHLPIWHRYWRIRRQALGYETLNVYDIKAPLTDKPPVVPYAQAVDWISEGMAPLGERYVSALRRGCLEERWIDLYPNQGKRSGAFSSGSYGTHPFILMSHTDDLEGMSTLAHELGHSLHSYFTWQTQPMIYSEYSLFVAEVASNFNQALVRAHLLATHDDPDFQLAVIQEAMSNFHRYFFIMPTLARFELEIHEQVERGEGLTAQGMISLMNDLFREGYGEEMAEDPDRIGITWAQFGHLYSSFYVYQYATGISGAHALAERVLAGEAGAADAYLGFLSAGSSGYPLDVLKQAGVDLTSPEPVEQTYGVLARLVDRLEQLVAARQQA